MWYEIYRFESQSKRFGCATMLYVLSDDNTNGYTVYNTYANLRTKNKMQIKGTAKWALPNDTTKLAILDIQYPKKGEITKRCFSKNSYKKNDPLFIKAKFPIVELIY